MISISRGLTNALKHIAFSNTRSSIPLTRTLRNTCALKCEKKNQDQTDNNLPADGGPVAFDKEEPRELTEKELKLLSKDRSKVIPVETSIRYLKSSAYKETYGDTLVWHQYRRNFKGAFPPPKTRKTCIRKNVVTGGSPCPICRDEYLVVDYRNIELLKQFISPHSGKVLSYNKTGVCQKKHFQLLVAIEKAKNYGLISYDVPYRKFHYTEYEYNKQH